MPCVFEVGTKIEVGMGVFPAQIEDFASFAPKPC